MAAKVRYYVNPSSLGSYFGVGFNSPEEQIEIDLGNVENDFDDDAIDRMSLGRHLEDAALNYFEEKLDIKIEDRNDKLVELYGGKVLAKIDGSTSLNGKKTVVEMKISNAKSYKFTESMGYIIQCQAYMMDNEYEQALLCGLWQGRPIYKIIERDEEFIEDLKEMIDFITGVLLGVEDWEDYPVHLLDKYGKTQLLESIENVSSETRNYWYKLGQLNAEKSKIEKQIKDLKASHENDLEVESGKFEDDIMKVSISDVTMKGKVDLDLLSIEHPELELDRYRVNDTTYKKVVIKLK